MLKKGAESSNSEDVQHGVYDLLRILCVQLIIIAFSIKVYQNM